MTTTYDILVFNTESDLPQPTKIESLAGNQLSPILYAMTNTMGFEVLRAKQMLHHLLEVKVRGCKATSYRTACASLTIEIHKNKKGPDMSTNKRFTRLLPDWATHALMNDDYTALRTEQFHDLLWFESKLNETFDGNCRAMRWTTAGLQLCNELSDEQEYCANVTFECFKEEPYVSL